MRKKLALVLTVLAMAIGSLSQAQAAVAPAPAAASGARALTPASVAGSGATAAVRVPASRRHPARRSRLQTQGKQRSLPGGLAPDVLPGGTIRPRSEAASPSPAYDYVANDLLTSGYVTPIATATGIAGPRIPVGKGPVALATTPDDATVYVANDGSGTVTPIATATNTAGTPIPVGHYPHDIAITPDGATAYVASYDGTVTPIATATNTPGPPIMAGNESGAIAINPDGTTAYVANNLLSGTVTPIDLTTKPPTVGTPIPVGSKPVSILVAPDGADVYVDNLGSDTVTPISTATDKPGTPIPVGSDPEGMAITPDGDKLFVADYGSDEVTPISIATDTAGTPTYTADPPIPVGGEPDQIAISPDGTTVYVANDGDDTETPINTATDTPGTPIPVGPDPGPITINPPPQLPDAPSDLTATLAGSSVSLTWADNDAAGAATAIMLERSTNAAFTDPVPIPLSATATSYTDTTVAAGTTYYYQVQAQDATGDSAWSTAASILVPVTAQAPAAPSGLTATPVGTSVSLTWTNSSAAGAATGMLVERATDAGFTAGVTDIPLSTVVTSYTDATVVAGTTYYYRVLARNQAGPSVWSTATSILVPVTGPPRQAPAAPSGLRATLAGTSVSLTWTNSTAAGAATAMLIERATNARFTAVTDIPLSTAATSYTDTTVVAGTTYNYRVQARNQVGNSAWSNVATIHVPVTVLKQAPAAPSGLTATLAGSSVSLTWTNSAAAGAATAMLIERATNARFTAVTDIPLGAAATSYTDTTVVAGTTYYYRVQAQNKVGDSAWSNAASILVPVHVPVPAPPLPAPANLTATGYAPGNAPARVILTWTERAPVTGFIVERATNARFTLGFAWVRVGRMQRSVTLAGLLRDHRYYVRILAVNGHVTSRWATLMTTTPGGLACRPGRWSAHRPGRWPAHRPGRWPAHRPRRWSAHRPGRWPAHRAGRWSGCRP